MDPPERVGWARNGQLLGPLVEGGRDDLRVHVATADLDLDAATGLGQLRGDVGQTQVDPAGGGWSGTGDEADLFSVLYHRHVVPGDIPFLQGLEADEFAGGRGALGSHQGLTADEITLIQLHD